MVIMFLRQSNMAVRLTVSHLWRSFLDLCVHTLKTTDTVYFIVCLTSSFMAAVEQNKL